MSQLQVTGEAKIRDIQGPVVANNGVITAIDGAASQYVRGDGTLADFPTSTGGGSSVSYYLNGSVNQGNIAGTVYYQMSKTPVIGTGTDFSISNNDLLAAFITDVNDPALLEVPGGNFNCEFYLSVNNNTGNPNIYAELYKVNGTTLNFTLLGTSVSIPEYINNGTTISPYYFAIPVANAALTATDRIAIRIFANVDGRTVTLHTENSHLCQVVTTFSKGLTTLNNLTKQVQYFAVGTSGTDFNIVSSGSTHTFNIPSADGSNRGLVTTGTQSFGGNKSFGGTTTAANLNVSGVLTVFGNLSNGTYSYTLPSAAGQLALTSQIPSISGTSYIVSRFNLAGTALENSSISDTGTYTGSPTGQVTINSRLAVNNFTELNRYLSIAQNPDQTWVPPTTGVNIELFFNSVTGIPSYAPDSAYIRARKASDDSLKRLFVLGSELILNQNTSGKTLINKQGAIQTTTKLEVAGYARFDNSINVIGAVYLNATDASQDTYFQAPSGNFSLVTSGTILLRSGANTGVYVADTGFVGINGATPTVALTVSGSGSFTGDLTVNGLINNTYSNNTFLGLNIRNTNTGDNALSGISIQNAGGTTVGQINYVSTVYANPTLRNTLLINTVFDNKLAFGTNSGGGTTRADIYFTVNPAFTLDVNNPNQIHILGTSRNVIINYSGTDFGAKFQVNGTTRLSDALTGTSATFSSRLRVNGATDDADIAMQVKAPSGTGKYIMFGRDASDIAKFTLSAEGAATFSSSVTANGVMSLGDDGTYGSTYKTLGLTGNANGSHRIFAGTSDDLYIAAATSRGIQFWTNGAATPRLTIASTGAATFSSSVTSNGFFALTTTSNAYNTQGTFSWNDIRGTIISGKTASVFDFAVYGAAAQALITNPTGTSVISFPSGNVGIGTSSPTGQSSNNIALQIYGAGTGNRAQLHLTNSDTGAGASDGSFIGVDSSTSLYISNLEAAATIFETNASERMRITSGGDLLVNTSSTSNASLYVVAKSNSDGIKSSVTTNGWTAFTAMTPNTSCQSAFFICSGNTAGFISHPSTTSTAYNTSSDYRLKEDLKDFNGINKIKAINVYDFKWKEEENRMFGVLAHELAEVLPYAVSGEKDAEYEDGKIKSQGVDYSFLTPLLVKAIQEQQAQIEELKAEIDELKNK